MLSFIRRHSRSWVAKIFFGLLILSFAIWGVGGLFNSTQNRSVANVGDKKVTLNEFTQQIRSIIGQWGQVDPSKVTGEMIRSFGIDQFALDELITQKISEHAIDNLALTIPNSVVKKQIIENELFHLAGKFYKKSFDSYLNSLGLTEAEYIDQVKRTEARLFLFKTIVEDIHVPKLIQEKLYLANQETRRLNFVAISKDSLTVKKPSEEDLKTFYDNNLDEFKTEEERKISYIHISPTHFIEKVTVTDEEVQQVFDLNKDRLVKPETREVTRFGASSKEIADKLAIEINSGKTLDEIRSSTPEGITVGETEWVDESKLIAKTAKQVFSVKKNSFTKPIKTLGGWNLFHVGDIREATEPNLEEEKETIVTQLKAEKALDESYALVDKLTESLSDGINLESIVQDSNLTLEIVNGLTKANLFTSEEFSNLKHPTLLSSIFEMETGEVSDILEPTESDFYIIRIDDIIAQKTKTFEDVKTEITDLWLAQEKEKIIEEKIANFEKTNLSETSLTSLFPDEKIEISKPFNRMGQGLEESEIPGYDMDSAFNADKSTPLSFQTLDKVIFAQVNSVKPGTLEGFSEQAAQIKEDLSILLANDILFGLISDVKKDLEITVNQSLIDSL